MYDCMYHPKKIEYTFSKCHKIDVKSFNPQTLIVHYVICNNKKGKIYYPFSQRSKEREKNLLMDEKS